MRFLVVLSSAIVLAVTGCSSSASDGRAARHAAARLGLRADTLRVTSQSDLTSPNHSFQLVTSDGDKWLLVILPQSGEPFDSQTEGAFERVSKAENATANLSRLGAERVALWFGALGGGKCPPPASTEAKFTTVERLPDGVRITYSAGKNAGVERTCVIELEADGSLRDGRLVERHTTATTAGW